MAACRASIQELRGVFVECGMAHSEWRHAAHVGQIIATIRESVRVCKPLYIVAIKVEKHCQLAAPKLLCFLVSVRELVSAGCSAIAGDGSSPGFQQYKEREARPVHACIAITSKSCAAV